MQNKKHGTPSPRGQNLPVAKSYRQCTYRSEEDLDKPEKVSGGLQQNSCFLRRRGELVQNSTPNKASGGLRRRYWLLLSNKRTTSPLPLKSNLSSLEPQTLSKTRTFTLVFSRPKFHPANEIFISTAPSPFLYFPSTNTTQHLAPCIVPPGGTGQSPRTTKHYHLPLWELDDQQQSTTTPLRNQHSTTLRDGASRYRWTDVEFWKPYEFWPCTCLTFMLCAFVWPVWYHQHGVCHGKEKTTMRSIISRANGSQKIGSSATSIPSAKSTTSQSIPINCQYWGQEQQASRQAFSMRTLLDE